MIDQLEKLTDETVLETYRSYLDSYLEGDTEQVASLLHPDFRLVNQAGQGEPLTKAQYLERVKNEAETLAENIQLHNRQEQVYSFGDQVVLSVLAEVFVRSQGDWSRQSTFRATLLLQKSDDKWLIMHQHGFLPNTGTPPAETADLKKALEQKEQELRIEAALERVRTRSMAMQNSSELQGVVSAVFANLKGLGIKLDVVTLIIIHEEERLLELWLAASGFDFAQKIDVHYFDHPVNEPYFQGRASNQEIVTASFSKELKDDYFKRMFAETNLKYLPKERKEHVMQGSGYDISIAFGENTSIQMNNYYGEKNSEQDLEILKRFARVFDQTYTRFLDLQKAEQQAREAEIEAALERVRGNALGMRRSTEMGQVTQAVFKELSQLGLTPIRFGIGLVNEEEEVAEIWITLLRDNKLANIKGELPLQQSHPLLAKILAVWQEQGTPFVYRLSGQELVDYYRHLSESHYEVAERSNSSLLKPTDPQYLIYIPYLEGGIFTFVKSEPEPSHIALLSRFNEVFHLTYTRYWDLKHSEERARETLRQASIDRVRAEIASMRSADDLKHITPLIWRELQSLGVPFFRCGVFIINENDNTMNTYISNPDGKTLATLHLSFDSTPLAQLAAGFWQKQQVYITQWSQDQYNAWVRSLVERGYIESEESFNGGQAPPESLALHFIPFKQGMLYFGSKQQLKTSQINETLGLAQAFEVAYARYEDFHQLEQAKSRLEQTLQELQATQAQLIQQEKLASLGQLTAGIAHEIKNPLNFVNNFSDLSIELIDEALEELSEKSIQKETEEAREILNDVKENLKKIYHHGNRADGIVKSMLMHSRGGGGAAEPTDLNRLVKEYVNLAFHGMRAGKNPMNVKINYALDEAIGKVELMVEDFSRVILNLCNNAFDAMRGKKMILDNSENYLPTLTVVTKKDGEQVQVSVEDNGPGIPDEIKDKILQPFFTTKKGTEGTGLGLSITHDIIKSHKGRIDIKTGNGSFTRFDIQLPIHQK